MLTGGRQQATNLMTHTVGLLINASGARFSFRLPRYQESIHGAVEQSPSIPDNGMDQAGGKK
ncbi:MAG TPA: hypothetical protein VN638_01620 [Nitrospiraceae bacterium]|nr:hypothetical protein [Nitrospiraceae bacterium]